MATSSRTTGRAYVFYERLLRFAQEDKFDEGLMLSYTLMHELGHMTANLPHDDLGIMNEFLERRQSGFLRFTRPQQEAIRTALGNAMKTNASFSRPELSHAVIVDIGSGAPSSRRVSRCPDSRERRPITLAALVAVRLPMPDCARCRSAHDSHRARGCDPRHARAQSRRCDLPIGPSSNGHSRRTVDPVRSLDTADASSSPDARPYFPFAGYQ